MSKPKAALEAPQLRAIAFRLLARREHSSYELRTKLLARGGTPVAVASILDELVAENYLADDRFTEIAVRARLRTHDGPLKIRAYLSQRGISNSLISHHLPNDEELWLERAVSLDQLNCEKRRTSEPDLTTHESWLRRSRLLKGRGYPAHIIRQVLESKPEPNS